MIRKADDWMLTPGEVGRLFRVDPKTVTRWATAGKFPAGSFIRTPGGHLRFRAEVVRKMLGEAATEADAQPVRKRSSLDWVSEQLYDRR